MRKLAGLAVAMAAVLLAASFGLLVLSRGAAAAAALSARSMPASTATTAAPAPAVSSPSCFPLTESGGTCYNAGEFCPRADVNMSGVARNGTPIACEPEANGTQPHWRACTPATSAANPASTAAGTLVCPATRAGPATTLSPSASAPTGTTTSAASGATAGAPAGAPATGGGTGPGIRGALAAAGFAVIVAGAGLVFLAVRRRTTKSL